LNNLGPPDTDRATQERQGDSVLQKQDIYQHTLRHFLDPIWHLIENEDVSEILINGPDKIYFEKSGRLNLSEKRFENNASLDAAVNNIAEYVNRRVDIDNHSMDARLPDGSRVHVIIAPSSRGGAHVSIRKFKKSTFNLQSLIDWGSINEMAAEFLEFCVILHKNTIISGGTGTGKTSMLNALSTAIPEHERIIVIEDSSELQLNQPHTVYLEAQPPQPNGRGGVSIRDLFVDSLRMRPDRIVMGEVRRGEALDMIQSMISGHAGSLTTVHANNPMDSLIRLETLCLMAGMDIPVYVVRRQVASAVNIVVQLSRMDDGSRRVITISEILGMDKDQTYIVEPIFQFRSTGRDAESRILGQLHWTGYRPSFWQEVKEFGFEDRVKHTEIFDKASSQLSSADGEVNGEV
jgi:pilus assembly protein CpaF